MNRTARWMKVSLLTFAGLLFLSNLAVGQCATDAFSGATLDSGDQAPTNANLNVYAAIFRDSDPRTSGCNAAAASHLRTKLTNTYAAGTHQDMLGRTVAPFHGWLEGSYVTYIFPAAIRLNEDGLLSSDANLQNLLQQVAASMNSLADRGTNGAAVALNSIEAGCGLDLAHGFANNCMDDYSIAAAGFAWAAAYERMMNGPLRDQLVDAAHFMIDKSFDTTQSICIVPNAVALIRDVQAMPASGRGPCTGTAATSASPNLQDHSAQTFSLNHNHQTPGYGFGLMTSISSAVLGLRLAGSDHQFSADEKTIAVALAAEASRLTEPITPPPSDYHFLNRPTINDKEGCLQVAVPDSTHFQITAPVGTFGDCADAGYYPRMYPVGDFYTTWIGPVTSTLPLGFGGSGLFTQGLPDGFFAIGREVYYGSLGWDARGNIMAPLAPLAPNPAYPTDGTLHVPASFTLRWNSGVDAARRYPWWPVTYTIYYKAWLYGAAEPASYTLFASNLQCNPDSTGVCTMPVSNISDGNYRWYVVANIDESTPTGSAFVSTQGSASYFTVGYQPISTIPAPLPPNPIYPTDGTLHAPSSFTLRWNDGLDASRRSPFWPVTYAIYYKAWNYGTTEPASYFSFGSGFQCNPDSSGACTLSVANVARGNYRWYVVVSMDVSASTGVANSILSTQGSVAFFTIGYDASVSIAWIQPSALSWGPANTLTAAGFATGGAGGVTLQWRDVTLNGPWNTVAYQPPPDPANGGWSNTIPSADNCHAFQATAQYSGMSASFNYDGVAQGYCSFRVIWIQPQSTAGFGPPGSLVVAGSAQGGPPNAQVTLWFRDDTAQSGWTPLSYAPIPDSTGSWYNAIENVDYTHQYSVHITFDDRNSGNCSYFGNGSATTCP
jgi:hypothetical protein